MKETASRKDLVRLAKRVSKLEQNWRDWLRGWNDALDKWENTRRKKIIT